jgi:hypothetical protein
MRVLVIGGSDAGISAGLRARELDPAAEVTLLVAGRLLGAQLVGSRRAEIAKRIDIYADRHLVRGGGCRRHRPRSVLYPAAGQPVGRRADRGHRLAPAGHRTAVDGISAIRATNAGPASVIAA